MLTRLDLRFFKCFKLLKLPISRLTLLSGPNSSGKSSILQALVLLHQTMREHQWGPRLALNGYGVRMGTVVDVVDETHGRTGFEIGIEIDDVSYHWVFEGERRAMSLNVSSVSINGDAVDTPVMWKCLLPHTYFLPREKDSKPSVDEMKDIFRKYRSVEKIRELTYITAERVGPKVAYVLEDFHDTNVVGPRGEHTGSVLHWKGDDPVLESLRLPDAVPKLLQQVAAQMRRLFPGFEIDVQRLPETNAVALGLRTSRETDFHQPLHTGFGMTQILPVIVAGFSAAEGSIMLVENPEVHLHPAGQALMGQFLAHVASAGVQVIVETHSDHVLNGVRRTVKLGHLPAEDVAIHFFTPRSEDRAQVHSPVIDSDGNIDVWPDGFFDQFDKDMNYFAGWSD